jgi:hypothetical protein
MIKTLPAGKPVRTQVLYALILNIHLGSPLETA